MYWFTVLTVLSAGIVAGCCRNLESTAIDSSAARSDINKYAHANANAETETELEFTVKLHLLGQTELVVTVDPFTNETVIESTIDMDDNSTLLVSRKKRIIPIMFARMERTSVNGSVDQCIGNPEDEFPHGFFSNEERKNGALAVAVLIGTYCFILLAVVCNDYFLPSVECICETLNLSPDVAAATFMSIATSAPELFVNIVGTFITHSDIGIGTVVGSSMFNCLGVAALGGLACTTKYIQIDWWPLTRDCIIYVLSVSLLVAIIWDNKVRWYEGLLMFIMYFVYFIIMFNNRRIARQFDRLFKTNSRVEPDTEKQIEESKEGGGKQSHVSTISTNNNVSTIGEEIVKRYVEHTSKVEEVQEKADGEKGNYWSNLFQLPEGHWIQKAYFIYTWPIRFFLFFTVPDCKRCPKLFPITFVMCILWIGLNSYTVSWMITVIGNFFKIPAAVLGLTFLAAGGCLPEAIFIVIMSRRGEGAMGVSNSLGANTMNILLSLGMPWFMKTVSMGTSSDSYIEIESANIQYTILALILVAILLFSTLYIKKFRLSRSTGGILMAIYLTFLLVAILLETLFRGELEAC